MFLNRSWIFISKTAGHPDKAGRKSESFSHSFLVVFPLVVMQFLHSFFKQVWFFLKKCLRVSGALYANIGHDPRSKYNRRKSDRSEHQWSWGVWGGFWDPSGVFRGWRSLRKSLGSKEHRDWLKTDLNEAEIITAQDYKHKKTNVNGSTYMQC